MDGSHVLFLPPADEEQGYVNRHHTKSLNVLFCCGPRNEFFFIHPRCPGAWHDARVLKDSSMWSSFESGLNPIPGGVILGDSAYPVRNWLIPPLSGDVDGAKLAFNRAHKRTRALIERSIGILKHRFYALQYGLRVKPVTKVIKLIRCAVLLHNLAIRNGDTGDDFYENRSFPLGVVENDEAEELSEERNDASRRQELIAYFNRQM